MTDSDGGRDSDRLSGLRPYLLLQMDRRLLTAGILVAVYVVLVLASRIGLTPMRQISEVQGGLGFFFTAFIGAIITGTSIVVTINQLVLSQELGAIGDQRERMRASMEFQRDVEDAIGITVTDPDPASFVQELLAGIEDRARELRTAGSGAEQALEEQIDAYTTELIERTESVHESLEDAQFGTFEVIWVALHFEYSWLIHEARSLRADHGEELPDDVEESIDDLVDILAFFGPTREHFKTLYFQWELINLSQALLYLAVPALAVMALFIMYVDAGTFTGTAAGVDTLVWVTSAGFVVGISPFVVFITYILRIATVAKWTLAMGPFILRTIDQNG